MNVASLERLELLASRALHYDIWGYTVRDRLMAIRVTDSNAMPPIPDFIICENVMYFLGPLQWQGHLRIGSPDELLSILRLTEFGTLPDDDLLSRFTLLQTISEGVVIHQLAANTIQICRYKEIEALSDWPFAQIGYPPF